MNPAKRTSTAFAALRGVFWLLSFCLLIPQGFYYTWGTYLDPSWKFALHLAWNNGLTFGRDLVFTYGPLGFLACRFAFPGIHLYLALWDLFLFGNAALILWIIFARLRSYSQLALAFLTCFAMGQAIYLHDASIVLFFVQLFFMLLHEREGKRLWLANACLASILTFYIKVNSGLIAIAVILAYGGYLALTKRRFRYAAIFSASYLSVFLLSSLVIPVDLPAYVISSVHIASGYNEGMYLEPGALGYESHFYAALTILFSMAGFMIASWRSLFTSWTGLWHCGLVALSTMLLFKQSFLRADGHCHIFFQYICLNLALFYFFVGKKTARRFKNIYAMGLAFALWPQMKDYTPAYFAARYEGIKQYADELSYGPTSGKTAVPPEAPFPPAILEQIGDRSVDIIPWDISLVFFNRLRYNPRPVMQTYSAYDSYLDDLNYRKYKSESRPDVIIYSAECIDDRYCFSDEAKTKLAILEHYRPAGEFADKILLERLEEPRKLKKIGTQSFKGRMNKMIYLRKPGEIEYLSIWPKYTIWGRLRSMLYQPPRLDITFFFANSTQQTFRGIKPILEGGILANRFVSSIVDAKSFFSGDISALKKVRAIRLTPSFTWAFESDFRYERASYAIERERAE